MYKSASEYLEHVQRNRRLNLMNLATYKEQQKVIAIRAGITQDKASHLIRGAIPFTEKTARQIEEHAGLEFGSLDKELES